jgi:hypothetical protein
VEFDTWDDTGLHGLAIDDYGSWHVALHSRGRAMNQPLQSATVGHTLLTGREDTLWHQVRIRYVPSRNGQPSLWSVWLDSTRVLAASYPLDSLLLDSGRAYVGFTAATMSAWERHEISNWVWNDSTAVPWYLRLTDTIVHIERYTDTVVHEVPLPPDTLYVDRWHPGDTVTIVRIDTLLVTRVDSVGYPLPPDTCYILRDTCCQNFDTVCGGSSRRMEPLLYRQGIDAIEPNPAGTTGTIRYTLGDRGAYTLAIYNSRGAQVWRAHGSAATEGRYQTTIDVTGWPPGFYIVRLYGPAGVQEGVMVVGE